MGLAPRAGAAALAVLALSIGVMDAEAAGVAVAPSTGFPTRVRVSLTRIPGNVCCPRLTRATVSARGVLVTATEERGGAWQPAGRRRLSRAELARLRSALRRFDPSTLHRSGAECNGAPIGDVGGYDLRVGSHESSCPPASANRLIRILSGWLPPSK